MSPDLAPRSLIRRSVPSLASSDQEEEEEEETTAEEVSQAIDWVEG